MNKETWWLKTTKVLSHGSGIQKSKICFIGVYGLILIQQALVKNLFLASPSSGSYSTPVSALVVTMPSPLLYDNIFLCL